MLKEKCFLHIIAKGCCIFWILKSIISFGIALFFSQQKNDWGDIRYELAFLVLSIILPFFWLMILFKNDPRFTLPIFFISILPFIHAVFDFILVLYNRHYEYEAIFIDVGIDDDIPFYSRLLAFIWIGLCSIPTVIFLRLWSLEKSSPVPHAVYVNPVTELLLSPV